MIIKFKCLADLEGFLFDAKIKETSFADRENFTYKVDDNHKYLGALKYLAGAYKAEMFDDLKWEQMQGRVQREPGKEVEVINLGVSKQVLMDKESLEEIIAIAGQFDFPNMADIIRFLERNKTPLNNSIVSLLKQLL